MYNPSLLENAAKFIAECKARKLKIAVAESCTGGLLAGLITSISGASEVFEMGFITYSNEAKTQLIGVDETLVETYGAVSEEVARAMAEGARDRANADVALSVTGIAGPGGATKEKPVGLVYIACATHAQITCSKNIFKGDRQAIRLHSCEAALEMGLLSLRGTT